MPALSDPTPTVEKGETGTLPKGLPEALGYEYARVFHPPFETFMVVALNAAIMSSAWFFLPPSLSDLVFSQHGSLAFAFILSSWMYSDVPATNVLAPDADRIVAAIDQPEVLHRILFARSLVLWSIVAPVCMVISFVNGFGLVDIYSAVAIGIIPLGVLAISAWAGILFPYHPIPIRFRWRHRKRWRRMLVRWAALVLLPYALVPGLTIVLLGPSLLIWGFNTKTGLTKKLPDNDLGLGIALACVIALGAVYLGQRVSLALIARRRTTLVAELSAPWSG